MNPDLLITIALCLYVLVASLAIGVLAAGTIREDNAKEDDAKEDDAKRRAAGWRARRREQTATVDEAPGGAADPRIGVRGADGK